MESTEFTAGDRVLVSADLLNAAGKPAPQAGKQGNVLGTVRGGKVQVDVPGMPLLTVAATALTPVEKTPAAPAQQEATPAAAPITTSAPGEAATPAAAPATTDTPKHADTPPVPGAIAYAFDVLNLTAIVPGRYQPRTIFAPELLEELADSIKAQGLAQPILVRPLPADRLAETFTDRRQGDPLPTHELVAGERRWRACKIAGVRSVPVLVRHLSDEQVAELQLVENVQRESLHALEEARGYRRMMDVHGYTIERLAARIRKGPKNKQVSTRYIYVTLQLLNLCEFAQQVFLEGKLERTHALQVATIGNEAQQIEATRRIAGLGAKGTEVVNDPMSLRAATDFVQKNYRLTLSKAPFSIKLEVAGIAACTGCPKNSTNAAQLFDNPNMPATCTDPSCYGKKNAAHTLKLAEEAKANGQQVITGTQAKKILPYTDSPEIVVGDEYLPLDERLYSGMVDSKHSGKTVAQLLGNDIPKPTLIQRPDGKGFVKALLRKDVVRLLKERGLAPAIGKGSDSASEENKKILHEKAARWAVAEKLVATAGAAADCPALLSKLLLPMALKLYGRLDNEASKRTRKLLGWDIERGGMGDTANKIEAHFRTLTPAQFNQFVTAACMADEVHYAQYYHPTPQHMDAIGTALGLDAKAMRAELVAAAKKADKDKASGKGKKAPQPAAKATASQAAPPAEPGTIWRPMGTVELYGITPGTRVKVIADKAKLGRNARFAGFVGEFDQRVGDAGAWIKMPDPKAPGGMSRCANSFHADELLVAVTDDKASAPTSTSPATPAAKKPAAKAPASPQLEIKELAQPTPKTPAPTEKSQTPWPFSHAKTATA